MPQLPMELPIGMYKNSNPSVCVLMYNILHNFDSSFNVCIDYDLSQN